MRISATAVLTVAIALPPCLLAQATAPTTETAHLTYSVGKVSVERGGKGDWIPPDNPSEIVITARRVSHLSVVARDAEMPYSEDDCLNCVSFVNANEATENSFTVSSPADPNLHYVFQFMSGFALRVQAEEALCHTTQ